jgi:hypothetical protein
VLEAVFDSRVHDTLNRRRNKTLHTLSVPSPAIIPLVLTKRGRIEEKYLAKIGVTFSSLFFPRLSLTLFDVTDETVAMLVLYVGVYLSTRYLP